MNRKEYDNRGKCDKYGINQHFIKASNNRSYDFLNRVSGVQIPPSAPMEIRAFPKGALFLRGEMGTHFACQS